MNSLTDQETESHVEAPARSKRPRRAPRSAVHDGPTFISYRLDADTAKRLAAHRAPRESLHQTARRLALAYATLGVDHRPLGAEVAALSAQLHALRLDARARHKDLASLSQALRFVVKRGAERDEKERARSEHDAELRSLLERSVLTLAERVEGFDRSIERLAASL